MSILMSESTRLTLMYLISIGLLIISYILGSIPFGVIFGKLFCKKDIRDYGSKNIGSTNAIRVLGKKVGFVVFFFDVFKGMAIILLVRLLKLLNVYTSPVDDFYYGFFAVLGHSFSIFLGYKGGKAVATSLGLIMVTSPLAAILCLVVFLLTLVISGYVSLASTFATITVIITIWVLYFVGLNPTDFISFLLGKTSIIYNTTISVVALLIIIKHFKNYKRLMNGTENSFKKKKKAV